MHPPDLAGIRARVLLIRGGYDRMVPFEVSIAILNHFFGLRPEAPKFEFATDSPLEGDGFEPSVPPVRAQQFRRGPFAPGNGCRNSRPLLLKRASQGCSFRDAVLALMAGSRLL